MKILRTIETDDGQGFQMGDKITVPYGVQDFTATCQVVKDGKALFFFDDCIDRRQMNKECTNKGGYAESDLKVWIDKNVFPVLQGVFGDKLQSVDIPTVEQLFGGSSLKRDVEQLDGEQLPLQKIKKNRICSYPDGEWGWYWLQNKYRALSFTNASGCGNCYFNGASGYGGVRIAFTLNNEVAK